MKLTRPALATTAALTVLCLFLIARPSTASPTITWTPQSVSQEVIAGSSTTTTISFSSDEKLTDVWVKVSSELGRVITVTPAYLGTVSQKQTVSLTATAHPAATTSRGPIQGTISLYRKTPSRDIPYGSSLQLDLEVIWPSAATPLITVTYPPTLAAQGAEIGQAIVSSGYGGATYVDLPIAIANNPSLPTVRVAVYANSAQQTLQDWFEQNIDGGAILLQSGSYTTQIFPDGKTALIESASFPDYYEGPLVTGYSYLISPRGEYIASVTLAHDHYLDQLGYATPEAVETLLQSITAALTFNE